MAARPRLFGIAYRVLGSAAEAEDIVQETWLRWQTVDRGDVQDPAAFLATITSRLAINCAKSARMRRESYVGPWLPEPVYGVPLGIPMLVAYSHYRVRHLQHHRYLGTPQDTEFFGFDTREPLTKGMLLRGLFDYRRLAVVVRDVARAATGRWQYELGGISRKMSRRMITEHLVLGGVIASVVVLTAAGYHEEVLLLWLLPLLLSVPMHFLVELPEHILCDTDTADVLRNTPSIRGSWFSTWFTNGNNLHIEHHAAMSVPINQLPTRHAETVRYAVHVERTYPDFYRALWQTVRR